MRHRVEPPEESFSPWGPGNVIVYPLAQDRPPEAGAYRRKISKIEPGYQDFSPLSEIPAVVKC